MLSFEQKLPRKYLERLLEKRKIVVAPVAPDNLWDLQAFRDTLAEIVHDDDKLNSIIIAPVSPY
jgi:hypothetical protein